MKFFVAATAAILLASPSWAAFSEDAAQNLVAVPTTQTAQVDDFPPGPGLPPGCEYVQVSEGCWIIVCSDWQPPATC